MFLGFFLFFLLLHPIEVILNADEIINGPTPGNHFRVISSATELLRVIFSPAQTANLGS